MTEIKRATKWIETTDDGWHFTISLVEEVPTAKERKCDSDVALLYRNRKKFKSPLLRGPDRGWERVENG